tara:strand:- start:1410 stop:1973 length:564 start_codon:yes stop_codon:yes gene_type:complete
MGLKQDLIDAKVKAAKESGMEELDTKQGSFIERDAHYTTEAILNFLTKADFTITQLKAPVIIESLKTPDQSVNIALETLLGDKAPILKTLKQIGNTIPGAGSIVVQIVDELESAIERAVKPLLEGGAKLPGLDLGKSGGTSGVLESTGYVYIGEDPDSQDSFDVGGEDGQRQFTTVKLIKENIEELM